jgi:ubiquinol-cytochrome c reductase cytochrome b subunit
MLRAVPNKLLGVLTMFGAVGLLFLTPWLDTSKLRSMRYRPTMRWFFLGLIVVALLLGWCGSKEPADVVFKWGTAPNGDAIGLSVTTFSQVLTAYYYAYFLVVLPLLGLTEKTLTPPETISTPVLSHGSAALPAGAPAQAEKRG